MADIETSVVISAQIDGLRSGMEAAANSVQAATDAMRAQLVGLGDIAQQAQSQLNAATAKSEPASVRCRPKLPTSRGR
jgi:hypothetical protein